MYRHVASTLFCLLLAAGCSNTDGPASMASAESRVTPDVSGVWVGSINIGATARNFTFILKQRQDGRLLGYVAGGTSQRVITGGTSSSGSIAFDFDSSDTMLTRHFHIAGSFLNDAMTATTDDGLGGSSQTVSFTRVHQNMSERRFIAIVDYGSNLGSLTEVDFVLGTSGVVSGGFVGLDDCGFLACGGGITAYSATSTTLTMSFETGGGCSGTGSLSATPLSNFLGMGVDGWQGTYTFTTCSGTTTGNVLLGHSTQTTTDDAMSVLTAFAQVADDLEAHTTLFPSLPNSYWPVSPSYLHNGLQFADLLTDFQTQETTYSPLVIDFSHFNAINTVTDPNTLPALAVTAPTVDFHDRCQGGVSLTTYLDADSDVFHDQLRYIHEESGQWVIYGNQSAQPFGVGLPYDPTDLLPQAFTYWPYGVRGGGHPEGHPGIDIELKQNAWLIAAGDGQITMVRANPGHPGTSQVSLQTGNFSVTYDEVDTSSLLVGTGDTVLTGDPLAHPGAIGSAPNTRYMIHFSASVGLQDLCPVQALNTAAHANFLNSFQYAFYFEQLDEPFLCNDPARASFAHQTLWTKQTSVNSANPAYILLERSTVTAGYTFTWLNATHTSLLTGQAYSSYGMPSLSFLSDGTSTTATSSVFRSLTFQPGAGSSYQGVFRVNSSSDTAASLLIDVGSAGGSAPTNLTNADTYTPTIIQ